MKFILEYFDPIVTNVANSYRLQEACDVLSLNLASLGATRKPDIWVCLLLRLPPFSVVLKGNQGKTTILRGGTFGCFLFPSHFEQNQKEPLQA